MYSASLRQLTKFLIEQPIFICHAEFRSVARNLLIRFNSRSRFNRLPVFYSLRRRWFLPNPFMDSHIHGLVSTHPISSYYSKGMICNHPLAIAHHSLLYGVNSNHPIRSLVSIYIGWFQSTQSSFYAEQ